MEKVELILSRCNDGQMHGFAVFDDGFAPLPLCETVVDSRDAGEDGTPMCPNCLPKMASIFNIPMSKFGL